LRFQFAPHSEIQGPVSFSKYLSNRRIKRAAAAQMIKKVTNHTTINLMRLEKKQSRQAEYDRLAALHGVVPDDTQLSGEMTLSRY
jgi:hypothetical protein